MHFSKSVVVSAALASSALWFAATPRARSAESKVYALLAFDTDIEGSDEDGTRVLRQAAVRNRDLIMSAFVQSFNQDGRRHRLEYKILEGRRVTWKNILDYWDSIDSNDDDVFVSYYFGHGAVDSEMGHYLALTHASEEGAFGGAPNYRCYIRSAMQARPNRMCVLLTDCCSSYVDSTGGLTRPAEGANWEVMKQLMFEQPQGGLMDVTAAELGTVARASTGGGFFTESLVHHLCGPLSDSDGDGDGDLTWREFLDSVRNRVSDVHRQPQVQHEFYVHKWGKIYNERELVVRNDSVYPINVFVNYQAYHSERKVWDWYGSRFYDTGQPVRGTPSWAVGLGSTTRLRDGGEFIVRGNRFVYHAKAANANWEWGTKTVQPIYGDHGYITDDGEIGTTTITFR